MALIDDPKACILRFFELEEREGRGSDCVRFPKGIAPANIPITEGELVFGVYKNKYYFAPTCLIVKDETKTVRIDWADVCRCSTRHGDGKKISDLLLFDGREIRVHVGDMATGWSGRLSQLYHQMIERYGRRPGMGRPLMPWREFFDKAPNDYSIAPNLEPHPSLVEFCDAMAELERSDEGTRILMHLVDDEDEPVADGLVILTPRPREHFQSFVASFGADGVRAADENAIRKVGPFPSTFNVWYIGWD